MSYRVCAWNPDHAFYPSRVDARICPACERETDRAQRGSVPDLLDALPPPPSKSAPRRLRLTLDNRGRVRPL